MARQTGPTERETLRPAMARHIRALGLRDVADYFQWCAEAGTAPTLDKSAAERAREIEIVAQRKAAIAKRTRLHRNPRRFIEDACAGRIEAGSIERPGWREAAAAISRAKNGPGQRESLAAFLVQLDRVSDLVFETVRIGNLPHLFLDGLIKLHERKGQWIREFAAWKPESHNAKRQFSSLLRHLLARYDVPVFLDAAWLRDDKGAYRFRDWFVHIANGKNIRTAKTPYPMTKMMAHHFVEAPADATIEGALMLADVKSLGGSARLAATLMGTRLGQRVESDPDRRAFWLSVYRFFVANPMLDLRHAGPIVDFLAFQKFETHEVMVGPGRGERRPPPQPNLTMSRRTPDSLLRQVEAWHGELRIARANDKRFWRSLGVGAFSKTTGPRDRPEEQWQWTIRELLSAQELVDEGRRMRHCVATYADSCAKGACSIWTMERRLGGAARVEPLLTVEVDAKRAVVEARGFGNRWPTEQEGAMLQAWMREQGLTAGKYLQGV